MTMVSQKGTGGRENEYISFHFGKTNNAIKIRGVVTIARNNNI